MKLEMLKKITATFVAIAIIYGSGVAVNYLGFKCAIISGVEVYADSNSDWIYYAYDNTNPWTPGRYITKVKADGTEVKDVRKISSNAGNFMLGRDGWIYYVYDNTDPWTPGRYIAKVKIDGTEARDVRKISDNAGRFMLGGDGWIYYVYDNTDPWTPGRYIAKVKTDGTEAKDVKKISSNADDFMLGGDGWIYYVYDNTDPWTPGRYIAKVMVDGTGGSVVSKVEDNANSFMLGGDDWIYYMYNGERYWNETWYNGKFAMKVKIDGTGGSVVNKVADNANSFMLGGDGWIYYIYDGERYWNETWYNGRFAMKMKVDGTGGSVVNKVADNANSFMLGRDGWIYYMYNGERYWNETWYNGKFAMKVKVDGTGGSVVSKVADNANSFMLYTNRAPAIYAVAPVANKLFSEANTFVVPTIEVSDANGDSLICNLYIDSEATPRETRTITNTTSIQQVSFNPVNIGALSEGDHTIKFEAKDISDSSFATVNIKVDKSAPVIAPNAFVISSTNTNITVSINAVLITDAIAGPDTVPYCYTITRVSDGNIAAQSDWTGSTTYSTPVNLLPNTQYKVRFEAKDAVGHTSAAEQTVYTKAVVPVVKTGNITASTLQISKDSTDKNPAGTQYRVSMTVAGQKKYVQQAGDLTPIETWITLDSPITVKGLSTGSSHVFEAVAKNQPGELTGLQSFTILTAPGVPTGLNASAVGGYITITWDMMGGISGYDLEIDGGSPLNCGVNNTYSYNASLGTIHTFRVRARNASAAGDWSIITSVLTVPGAPSGFVDTKNLNGDKYDITLTWTVPLGASKYEAEADGASMGEILVPEYIHAGRQPGTTVSYRIRAGNASGWGDWSTIYNAVVPPGAPANIMAMVKGDSVELGWEAVFGAASYEIQVDGGNIDTTASTGCTVEGLNPDTPYTFKIRSVNQGGKGEWSSDVTKTTLLATPRDISALSRAASTTLMWKPVSGAEKYELEVDGNIHTLAATQYTHEGLNPATTHTYRVRALSSTNTSDWSEKITKTTLPFRPGVPVITGINAKSSAVEVEWTSVGAIGYDIEIDDGVTKQMVNTGMATAYSHGWTKVEGTYTFRVRARNEGGKTEWSDPSSITTRIDSIFVPSGLKAEPDKTRIRITWDPMLNSTGYELEIDGGESQSVIGAVYAHEGVKPGSKHTYRVRSVNEAEVSEWSSSITAKALMDAPEAPINMKAEIDTESIRIIWDAADNISRYILEIDGDRLESVIHAVYDHRGLEPGLKHRYKVKAINSEGMESEWSDILEASTLPLSPEVPGGFGAEASEGTIKLVWEPVTGADGYEIDIDNGSIVEAAGTEYRHTGLAPETQHTYRIRAVNAGVKGPWSSLLVKATPVVSIGVPANLLPIPALDSITLKWGSVAGATGYQIELDGKEEVHETTETAYTHRGLRQSSKHSYRIRALKGDFKGAWSKTVSSSTLVDIPQTPGNVKPVVVGNVVKISWDSVTGAQGYQIEIDGAEVETVSEPSFLHTGGQHIYRIKAINSGVESDWSQVLIVSILSDGEPDGEAPVNVQAQAYAGYIKVTWEEMNTQSYEVEVDGRGLQGVTSAVYNHTGLMPGTQHTYRVRTVKDGVAGSWSKTVTGTMPVEKLKAPGNFRATATEHSIRVVWDEVSEAESYELEIDGTPAQAVWQAVYEHTGLERASKHTYRVRAKNVKGEGAWSPLLSKTVAGIAGENVPSNLTGIATLSTIKLTWEKVPGAMTYDLLADGVEVKDILGTTYSVTGLLPSTNHTFQVRANMGRNQGDWSEESQVWTLPSELSIPAELSAQIKEQEITVTWIGSENAMSYEIEIDGGEPLSVTNVVYAHQGLEPDTAHKYRVRAVGLEEKTDWSKELTVRTAALKPETLAVPEGITAAPSTRAITLSWKPVEGAEGYAVRVDGNTMDNGKKTTFTHSKLEPGTTHTYSVMARNKTEVSPWSMEISATTRTTNYQVACTEGEVFNLAFSAMNVESFENLTFSVAYKAEELELLDLCSATPEKEVKAGAIEGGGIEVTKAEPGLICFKVTKMVAPGKAWSGVVNSMKFKAKINGSANVTYTIE